MTLVHRQSPTSWVRLLTSMVAVTMTVFGSTAFADDDKPSAGNADLFNRLDTDHNGIIASDEIIAENRPLFERLLHRGDANHDKALSREEFLAALVPTRPEKPIEAKQPEMPQADAVRYLLLTLDKNQNAAIDADEIPKQLKGAFEFVLERLDGNKDGRLDRNELSRGGPALGQIALRYAERQGVDVKAELAKLGKSQGDAANRFDDSQGPMERLADPKKARQMFKELDANGDGYVTEKELSEIFRERADRFTNMGDRDRDGRLSEREFLDAAERVSRFMGRQQKEVRRDFKARKTERKSKPANSAPDDKK